MFHFIFNEWAYSHDTGKVLLYNKLLIAKAGLPLHESIQEDIKDNGKTGIEYDTGIVPELFCGERALQEREFLTDSREG